MFSVSDMSGEKPEQTTSFNPSKILLYKGTIVLAITIIAATWGAGVIIANIMTSTASINFEHRLEHELSENGKIYITVEHIVDKGNDHSDARLQRMEDMLDPMYTKMMGVNPPQRVAR